MPPPTLGAASYHTVPLNTLALVPPFKLESVTLVPCGEISEMTSSPLSVCEMAVVTTTCHKYVPVVVMRMVEVMIVYSKPSESGISCRVVFCGTNGVTEGQPGGGSRNSPVGALGPGPASTGGGVGVGGGGSNAALAPA